LRVSGFEARSSAPRRLWFATAPWGGSRTVPRRFVTIGRYDALTVNEARTQAKAILGAVAKGDDPAGERHKRRREMTVSAIDAASRATSVPRPPIATPISAALSDGASFTPSPVIATTSASAFGAWAIRSFCTGWIRANTQALRTASALREATHYVRQPSGGLRPRLRRDPLFRQASPGHANC
jgi:hypothetical protein